MDEPALSLAGPTATVQQDRLFAFSTLISNDSRLIVHRKLKISSKVLVDG
jgi:hypothetical protein